MGFLYLPKRAGPSLHLHDNTGLPAPLSGGTGRVVASPRPVDPTAAGRGAVLPTLERECGRGVSLDLCRAISFT
jgi:hypothetical protein